MVVAKYGKPIWKIVLEAAKSLDKSIFSAKDIIDEAHKNYPDIPDTSLRTYVVAMAPEHPSSHHYPSTRKNHPSFKYLGSGRYSLNFKLTPVKEKTGSKEYPKDSKTEFIEKFRNDIQDWVTERFDQLIEARKNYSWENQLMLDCVHERNLIQSSIVKSRIRNGGGLDLATLDKVLKWGGLRPFPTEEVEALRVTYGAFELLDKDDVKGAILKLLDVNGIGISSASKIIGLYDQNRYAIYDSRVGTALRTLVHEGKRIIKCPAGRGRQGDSCNYKRWAENYEKLIWVLEIIGGYLSERGYPFNVSDVEMALFMLGK
jgi:hypothetical protein